ncbi:MAG: hypothetical protein M1834_003365 [Cirrosporium novae-zelandiae]|nr:MAG: hypothetical protein M1834_003365 [Cirrosporium novae-zelandiae]
MDRSLDEIISERPQRANRGGRRGGRGRRNDHWSRDGARKSNNREERGNPDLDWVHDKFEDDRDTRRPERGGFRSSRPERYSDDDRDERQELFPDRKRGFYYKNHYPNTSRLDYSPDNSAKLRVDNLHYDLTEKELEELFTRIGPVSSLSIRYDRAGRSEGTAYVTYISIQDANEAIRNFDGANAYGQPIRVTLLPTAPSHNRTSGKNPFGGFDRDQGNTRASGKGKSLFERVSGGPGPRDLASRITGRPHSRSRSASPGRAGRRSDVSKPPPDNIDRYVPGRDGRTRSPIPRNRRRGGGPINDSRNNRGRRGDGRGKRGDLMDIEKEGADGHKIVNGRPRKTQEELDKEMDEYWGSRNQDQTQEQSGGPVQQNDGTTVQQPVDEDIDMIE